MEAMELPFNRSEVFFTATVLPAILQADDFANLARFAAMLGVDPPSLPVPPTPSTLILWTEFNYVKSRHPKHVDKTQWPPLPSVGTPDVLLLWNKEPRLLLLIEAKMFNTESRIGLHTQISAQRLLLTLVADRLGVAHDRALHVTILPKALHDTVGKLTATDRQITWEQVREELHPDSTKYWFDHLDRALQEFVSLQGVKSPRGQYAEGWASGVSLAKDGKYATAWMGCSGGFAGLKKILEKSDAWRDYEFEFNISATEAPSRNWFEVSRFRYELVKRHLI